MALGTALRVFGCRQGRQVQIQPQPVLLEGMPQRPAFTPKQLIGALPQLRDLQGGESIQRAGHTRLVGKTAPAPGVGQG